jgi:hypothetical protein
MIRSDTTIMAAAALPRVILVAAAGPSDMPLMAQRWPAARLPLMDRPFIQHLLERLVRCGFRDYEIILSQRPETVEALLGDGIRWGCRIRYHLVRNPLKPYGPLRFLLPADTPHLLARADRLPGVDLSPTDAPRGPHPVCLTCETRDGGREWTGWAWLPPAWPLPPDLSTLDETGLSALLLAETETLAVPRPVAVDTVPGLLAAHRAFFDGHLGGLMVRGREVEPGIWMSRNVSLHPSARLRAPVYMAEDCRVGPAAIVGPYSVIGDHCVLDAGCRVVSSVVAPGRYVGEGLELEACLVDKSLMVSARLGSEVLVNDDFLLGALDTARWKLWCLARLHGLLALALLALGLPLGLLIAAGCRLTRPGPLFDHDEMLHLPAHPDPSAWRTVRLRRFACRAFTDHPVPGIRDALLRVLPGLWDVARGRLRLVGLPPRSPAAVKALPEDWRNLYLACRAGLITENMVRLGPQAPPVLRHAVETVYAASADIRYDFRLMGAYLMRSLHLLPSCDALTAEPETDANPAEQRPDEEKKSL